MENEEGFKKVLEKVTDIKVYTPRPGDVLLLKVSAAIDQATAKDLAEFLKDVLPVGVKVVVADTEATLEVIRPQPLEMKPANKPGCGSYAPVIPPKDAELVPDPSVGIMSYTGTYCSICKGPQFRSPSEVSCSKGHGGEDAL